MATCREAEHARLLQAAGTTGSNPARYNKPQVSLSLQSQPGLYCGSSGHVDSFDKGDELAMSSELTERVCLGPPRIALPIGVSSGVA